MSNLIERHGEGKIYKLDGTVEAGTWHLGHRVKWNFPFLFVLKKQ